MIYRQLQDGFGRSIEYLRLSVTDRCDFRCVYCMAEDMTFLPRQQVLSLEEIQRVGGGGRVALPESCSAFERCAGVSGDHFLEELV